MDKKKELKILVISNISNSLSSGIAVVVPKFVDNIAKSNNVTWLNLNKSYVNTEFKNIAYISEILKLKNILKNKDFNFDIAIFHGVYFYTYKRISKLLLKLNIPYIITPHGSLTNESIKHKRIKKIIGIQLFVKSFTMNSSAVHFLSEGERSKSRYFREENSFVVSNGIDFVESIQLPSQSVESISAVYIGRYSIYHKGLDLLLLACGTLREVLEKNGFVLSLYGIGSKDEIRILKNLITENKLEKIVNLSGPVYGEEKIVILSNNDLFIQTSRSEGQPMGVLEALSYGKPCLLTIGTNLTNELKDFDSGWVAHNNPESIVDALLTILQERHLFEVKSINARKMAKTFSWSYITEQLTTEFNTVIGRGSK